MNNKSTFIGSNSVIGDDIMMTLELQSEVKQNH